MNAVVARMLGEAVPPEPSEDTLPDESEPTGDDGGGKSTSTGYVNPTVEQLVAAWQGGSHESVAIRVLDALDLYEDFVELLFRIGHEGAVMLASIMDEMTADQKSDHAYDEVNDLDLGRSARARGTTPPPVEALPKPPRE
jgi:hypothetical protein